MDVLIITMIAIKCRWQSENWNIWSWQNIFVVYRTNSDSQRAQTNAHSTRINCGHHWFICVYFVSGGRKIASLESIVGAISTADYASQWHNYSLNFDRNLCRCRIEPTPTSIFPMIWRLTLDAPHRHVNVKKVVSFNYDFYRILSLLFRFQWRNVLFRLHLNLIFAYHFFTKNSISGTRDIECPLKSFMCSSK